MSGWMKMTVGTAPQSGCVGLPLNAVSTKAVPSRIDIGVSLSLLVTSPRARRNARDPAYSTVHAIALWRITAGGTGTLSASGQ